MKEPLSKYLNHIRDASDRRIFRLILRALADRLSTRMLNSAALVIKTGGSALVKTGATACHALADGKIRSIAAATDMPALAGTVVNATFNVFVYTITSGGTVATSIGTAGATLAAVKFPVIAEKVAVIGFTIINPTGTGDFVGGTTPIDDGTVTPNAVHVSSIGGLDPTVLL